MSFVSRMGGLTEELVSIITTISPTADPERFNVFRESALRSLRHHTFLRTNQFLVDDQLRGLEERFRVNSRERLADALQSRLEDLAQCSNKFTPEVLHLLLELSDQPTQKSRLSDLDALRPPDEAPAPSLTWEEIAREDGWKHERDIWRTVAFDDSSEDEATSDADSDASLSAQDSTLSSVQVKKQRTVHDIIVEQKAASSLLQQVQESQGWRKIALSTDRGGDRGRIRVPETHVVREVLFLLNGLPTTLFGSDSTPQPDFQLANVSWSASESLLGAFGDCGRRLNTLRGFVQSKQPFPLVRAFQDAVRRRMLSLDGDLAVLQARFISGNGGDIVVSLIALLEEVTSLADPLFDLAAIVRQLKEQGAKSPPFRCLELLFNATTAAQAAGNDRAYKFLGIMFFECFEFYLRPLRLWMEEGKLGAEAEGFFVKLSADRVALSSLWQDKYSLVHGADGVLHAPHFLGSSVKRIFATGKSVVVLQHLGKFEAERSSWSLTEPPMNFGAVCPPELDIAPFPQLFRDAFDQWIQSKHHTAAATLRSILFESCGLLSTLSALQQVYFMTNGFVSASYNSAIFGHLDSLDPIWKDRLTLTELARESFAHLPEAQRLMVSVDQVGLVHSTMAARISVRDGLPAIRVTYRLPWPVQLVLRPDTLTGYQSVFSLLLQLSRAMRCLERYKPLLDIDTPWTDEQRLYCNVRSRLLGFTTTVYTYLTSVVLGPSVSQLQRDLEAAVDIDDMIEVHGTFMKKTVSEGCLNLKLGPIHDCILDMLDLCIRLEDCRVADAARSEQQGTVEAEEAHAEADSMARSAAKSDQSYMEALQEIRGSYESHLRFICSGLRAVARATLGDASGKWDMLAEMLEPGRVEHA